MLSLLFDCRTVHHRSIALSLEQWYMVFSLLSAATSGAQGRVCVWRSVCFLLEQDLVGDLNFTPCRHLVLRFLHGSVSASVFTMGADELSDKRCLYAQGVSGRGHSARERRLSPQPRAWWCGRH